VLVDVVNGRFPPPRQLRQEIPEGLERVVLRALRVAPEDRFPSLRALGAALLRFASPRKRLLWEETFSERVPPTEGKGLPAFVDEETDSAAGRPERAAPTVRTSLPPPVPLPRIHEGENVVLTPRLPAWVWVVPALLISATLAYLAYRVSRPVEVAPLPPVESPRPRPPVEEAAPPPRPPAPERRPSPAGKGPARRPQRTRVPPASAPPLERVPAAPEPPLDPTVPH
jgi:hypothetical protein